jgi:hypothetical protein
MSAMLAEVLADSHGYTTLNLGDNMLGDEAVAEVGAQLLRLTTLRHSQHCSSWHALMSLSLAHRFALSVLNTISMQKQVPTAGVQLGTLTTDMPYKRTHPRP